MGKNSTLELHHGERGGREEFHPGTLSWRKGRWGGIPPWNFIMEKGEVGRNSTLELYHGERGGREEFHPGTSSWQKGK